MPRINAFLKLGRDQGGSDIHLAVGSPPLIRLHGDLMPIKYRELSSTELEELVDEILTPEQKKMFQSGKDLDFSYDDPEVGRFRVNLFKKVNGIGASLRAIAPTIPSMKELGLPPIIEKFLHANQGIVLVTGATGTGKSTTLASMIDWLNKNRRYNIITLEDPIEYVHKSSKSLVVQRAVGTHVDSFAAGLRAALREDPDVILVGELRDPETISMAMTAAETGHLVLGTLHTTSAVKTLDRIVDAMPTEQKALASTFLAQHLKGVISQKLVRTFDGRHRKAMLEIMVNTPSIASLILNNKIFQIPSSLQTGREVGMQLMDQALLEGVKNKEIDADDAYLHATDKKLFQRYVSNPDLLPQINLAVT
ncbi:MAG: type IV pilus twitching motility protein PilT [Gammaproteobacteria bacterium]|nr:type IV pilus twitching motility protein PilT [Gammaproteobacteria bacterium]MDH5778254.1 type IV pilus twitching motility protein PilT [Gammaproteobacteria bacterium]